MIENFTNPEDIAADESFIAWYKGANSLQSADWEGWMASAEGRRGLVNQAIAIVESVFVNEKKISAADIELAHTKTLAELKKAKAVSGKMVSMKMRTRWVAAASVLVLFGLSAALYMNRHAQSSIDTAYGQVLQQRLPDGTEVTINANSHLSYTNLSNTGDDREVWLKGEAFFHVSKQENKRRFVVHTDHFDVIVTGTQFNVLNRDGLSNVMLREGSVNVKSGNGNEIKMVPGDYVEYANNETKRKLIKNDSLLAWKDQRLVFDNTLLSQVIRIIREHYGVEVKLSTDTLGYKTISGVLPNDNLDILLQAINATNDLEVIHKNGDIIIRSRQ